MLGELRLGDIIDDYCVKCRRLTNHAVVSIMNGVAAKVRCRTCYGDHDYRNEQIPPSKKDLKKAALFAEVLAGAPGVEGSDGAAAPAEALEAKAAEENAPAAEAPEAKAPEAKAKRAKKT